MPGKEVSHSATIPALVTFTDSLAASKAIQIDDVDGFFNEVQQTDIEIQMKRTVPFPDRSSAVRAYRSFLGSQVSEWTVQEKDSMLQVFQKVKKLCDAVSPRLFPAGISLIKMKTGTYGRDVYFTRGKHILIPENIFEQVNMERQLPVMLHEVFHIVSRYNKSLRHDLYKMIGFVPMPHPVKYDETLAGKVLTNPDGVSRDYGIILYDFKDTMLAIPVIQSKFAGFRPDVPSFFDYVSFDLYAVDCNDSNCITKLNAKGKTSVPPSCTSVFFQKIRDNTQYIIHPDEIMADNFMLALLARESNNFSRFSREGRELINKILERMEKE